MSVRSMILVSNDPESRMRGSEKIFSEFQQQLSQYNLADEVSLTLATDLGSSYASPLVIIYPEAVIYGPVTPADVPHIVEEHLYKGRIVDEKRAPAHELSGKVAWLSARKGTLPAENRVVLKNVGLIDPEDIEDYIANDGYQALGMALEMSPDEVIDLIKPPDCKAAAAQDSLQV